MRRAPWTGAFALPPGADWARAGLVTVLLSGGCHGTPPVSHGVRDAPCGHVGAVHWLRGRWCGAVGGREECEDWHGPGETFGLGCGPRGTGVYCDELLGATVVPPEEMAGRRRVHGAGPPGAWPLRIESREGALRYVVDAYGASAAVLRLARCAPAEVTFEGLVRGVPTRITYSRSEGDSLVRTVEESLEDGGARAHTSRLTLRGAGGHAASTSE